ncbi:hypothetical protein PANI_CDS0132 [Maribacter phage Panino]
MMFERAKYRRWGYLQFRFSLSDGGVKYTIQPTQ